MMRLHFSLRLPTAFRLCDLAIVVAFRLSTLLTLEQVIRQNARPSIANLLLSLARDYQYVTCSISVN